MSRLEELIRKSQCGDMGAKECLVSENTGLIWSVTKHFLGRGVESEDLYQLGCLGFIKAIDGFSFEYGTQFSTYAVPKIAGEIRRFLRDDGTVKVSRGMKEQAVQIKTARNTLLQSLQREPTLKELSDHTGIPVEEIALAENATATVESIYQSSGEEGFTLENILTDTESDTSMLEKIALRQAIDNLPEREKTVIKLRYYHGLTQDHTAKVMSVSQVQISRIEKKALTHLREMMNGI